MRKQIYYLKDEEPDFVQAFESVDEVISWTYRIGTDKIMFSTALKELTETFYNPN